jgi:hypothetical protein
MAMETYLRTNTIDPTDPQSWGTAVERAAEAIARMTWGPSSWYRGAANAALTDAFELDAKDTQRVLMAYHSEVLP